MTIDMEAIHDSDRTLVMGVLNITEDSSSDGGLWLDPANAKAHGEAMMKDGADIIDIGPEGGAAGGEIVAAGTPHEIACAPRSYTGEFLKKLGL